MKAKIPLIARYLLGLLFFASGLAGLLNLAPPPADMPPKLAAFFAGISSTEYFIPFLKITETACGLMLLARIAPALALIILAPVAINIVLVHSFLTPGLKNLILPAIIVVLHVTAATAYWQIYRPLFKR
jgi:uncharacterized membrane protein YphA (DoxX/SURF4 family)